MRRTLTVLMAAFLMVPLLAIPATAASAEAELTVIHGIPGVVVDVYVDGAIPDPALDDFEFTDLATLTVPASSYLVQVMLEGEDPKVDTPVLEADLAVPPGGNVTAVAHLDGAAAPALSAFNNDLTPTNVGQARVTARHLAAAPAVDITANGGVLFGDVENGESGSADVPAGSYAVGIDAPPGSGTEVFDVGTVPASANTSVIAYAVGNIAGAPGDFTVVPQIINLPAPTGYANLAVVHGIPGLTVDVYLNGQLTLPGFTPETITGRLIVPAGTYDIAIYAAGANPLADKPALSAPGVAVPVGAAASVVAHLDAGGTPTASVFIDDFSMSDAGNGRLTVRHTAAAPPVGVVADGVGELFALSNGQGGSADVPAGDYDVYLVAPPGSDTQVFPASGFVDLTVTEGANTFVYAIGTFGGDFKFIASVVPGIGGFADISDSVHKDNIITMSVLGITRVEDDYRPTDDVTRGEMAAFMRRALNLPAAPAGYDPFTDDDSSIFEGDINAISFYGITLATGGEYKPNEPVTRGQMAAFIKRGFQLGAAGATPFTDIDDSIFKGDIQAIFAAGITVGTSPTTYSPDDDVTRGQMATFLARALGFES